MIFKWKREEKFCFLFNSNTFAHDSNLETPSCYLSANGHALKKSKESGLQNSKTGSTNSTKDSWDPARIEN